MRHYLTGTDAVSDLHKSGFINDFQFLGDDLLWVQEKIVIRVGEFAILECHKIKEPNSKADELMVFAIVAPYLNIKGILVNHCKC
jgi:hypothetical protein